MGETAKSDHDQGFYRKYRVERTDGDPTGRHEKCLYFVLDLDHDVHAKAAIMAYERSCRSDCPRLAADLRDWLICVAERRPMEPPIIE